MLSSRHITVAVKSTSNSCCQVDIKIIFFKDKTFPKCLHVRVKGRWSTKIKWKHIQQNLKINYQNNMLACAFSTLHSYVYDILKLLNNSWSCFLSKLQRFWRYCTVHAFLYIFSWEAIQLSNRGITRHDLDILHQT